MASLLANVESTSAGTSPAAFADVPALSATVSIASTSSIVILVANVPIEVPGGDGSVEFRFAVDGVREGPYATCFADNTRERSDLSGFVWMLTGVSGSITFSLQWRDHGGSAIPLDTTQVRNFQVLEIP